MKEGGPRENRPVWTIKEVVYNLETLLPVLVEAGEISSKQAEAVAEVAGKSSFSLRNPEGLDFILKLGLGRQKIPPNAASRPLLTEETVLTAVASHFGLEFKHPDPIELDMEVCTKTISESFAKRNRIVPLRIKEGMIEVLAHNPFHPELWRDMSHVATMPFRVFLGARERIARLIDDNFQFSAAVSGAEKDFAVGVDLGDMEQRVQVAPRLDPASEKHVVKAVDYLLKTAFRERASDIHLEPKRERSEVRFRIDGILHTLYKLPLNVHQAMISRLKSLSRMDIAEKRRPQDGRFQIDLEGTLADVRLSTIPTAFGEKMVLRILSSQTTLKKLLELGFSEDQTALFLQFVSRTGGLMLVTGPTGSGKTTTLYSCMKLLATSEVNVVTVEDPIEMVVDDFNQIGIMPRAGVEFGNVLRHILRQDPDVIMIGEMRDLETAEQAVQSALTGHLVLSTLHTNDAASSVVRLLELGLPAFLINASLVGVVAQRLVRTICPFCKVRVSVPRSKLEVHGITELPEDFREVLWKGAGCVECRRSGYKGRTGIFELLPMTDEFKEAIRKGIDADEFRRLVRSRGVNSLFSDGFRKAMSGETTFEEVLRVVGSVTD